MIDPDLKACPFCGDPMTLGRFGDMVRHVDQGACPIGSLAWPVENVERWNARSAPIKIFNANLKEASTDATGI